MWSKAWLSLIRVSTTAESGASPSDDLENGSIQIWTPGGMNAEQLELGRFDDAVRMGIDD